jgi:hypothetical protein
MRLPADGARAMPVAVAAAARRVSAHWPWLLLGILVLGGGLLSSGPIDERDIFWHVASGRFILEERRLPEPDPFTFTAGDRRDVHHEWLAQVILAAVERAAGLRGLRVLRAILEMSTMVLGWAAFRRRSDRFLLVLPALCLWWILYQPNTTVRPHLFGWLLAVLVLGLLTALPVRGEWRRHAGVFLLLVLWANLHSSVAIVPAVFGLHWLGVAALSLRDRRWDFARLRRLALPGALSFVACLLQPAGFGLFAYLRLTRLVNQDLSIEWRPLLRRDVWVGHAPMLVAFGVLTLAVIFAAWKSDRSKRSDFPGLLVAVAALILAGLMRRMTFFLFLPMLYVLPVISGWLDARVRLRPRPVLAAGLSVLLVASALAINRRPGIPLFDRENIVHGRFPESAADFLAGAQLRGRMFNPVDWGGYLSYRLYPGYRTLGDGRWTLIGREVVLDSQRVLGRRGDVEGIFDRYGIDFLVQPMAAYLRTAPLDPKRWVLAYHDDVSVVLLRRTVALRENLGRASAFYARFPFRASQGRWQVYIKGAPGQTTQTSIPSVFDFNPADDRP